jgi:hypothetical protein
LTRTIGIAARPGRPVVGPLDGSRRASSGADPDSAVEPAIPHRIVPGRGDRGRDGEGESAAGRPTTTRPRGQSSSARR